MDDFDVMAGTGGTVGGMGESVVRLFWLPLLLWARDGRVVPGQGPLFFCTPEYTHSTPASLHLEHVAGSAPAAPPPASHLTLRARHALHALVVRDIGARDPMGEKSNSL